jgi:membrane-bound ClpP family serine protease
MYFMKKSPQHAYKEEKYSNSLTYLVFFIAASSFISALFFPAFLAQTQDIDGYWVLFLGWLGFLFFQFAWYAAPLMLLAVYTSAQSPRFAFLLAVLAIIIASEAFLFDEIPLREAQQKILGYGLGFYLWYGSFYIAALGVLQKLLLWHALNNRRGQVSKEKQSHSPQAMGDFDLAQPRIGVAKKVILSSCKPPPLPKKEQVSVSALMPPPLPVRCESDYVIPPPPLPRRLHAN